MSELETAQRHLNRAVRRLEIALSRRLAQPPGEGSAAEPQALARLHAERDRLAHDVSALQSECDRLSMALGEAQHDNRSLREASAHVAQRLDGSIADLDRLLGG
jgi:outer membrane murein-binding lipoprotein Lpp